MGTQESCSDSGKNKMLGNEVEWRASDKYIYIYIWIHEKCYVYNIFIIFLQQIIRDKLLLVGKKVILIINSIITNNN